MEYHFNTAWFIVGLMIVCAGGLFLRYHMWIADNFGGGLGSYDRYKLAAVIMIVVGLVASVNLHTLILGWIFGGLFSGISNN